MLSLAIINNIKKFLENYEDFNFINVKEFLQNEKSINMCNECYKVCVSSFAEVEKCCIEDHRYLERYYNMLKWVIDDVEMYINRQYCRK